MLFWIITAKALDGGFVELFQRIRQIVLQKCFFFIEKWVVQFL